MPASHLFVCMLRSRGHSEAQFMLCALMCSSAVTQACNLRAKRWKAGVRASCQQVVRRPGFQAAQSVRCKLLNHQHMHLQQGALSMTCAFLCASHSDLCAYCLLCRFVECKPDVLRLCLQPDDHLVSACHPAWLLSMLSSEVLHC